MAAALHDLILISEFVYPPQIRLFRNYLDFGGRYIQFSERFENIKIFRQFGVI